MNNLCALCIENVQSKKGCYDIFGHLSQVLGWVMPGGQKAF